MAERNSIYLSPLFRLRVAHRHMRLVRPANERERRRGDNSLLVSVDGLERKSKVNRPANERDSGPSSVFKSSGFI